MEDSPVINDCIADITLAIRENNIPELKAQFAALVSSSSSRNNVRLLKNGFIASIDHDPADLSIAKSLAESDQREVFGWGLDVGENGELGLWRVDRPPTDKPYQESSQQGDEGWMGTDWDSFGKNNVYGLNDYESNTHAHVAKWLNQVEESRHQHISMKMSLLSVAWSYDNQEAVDIILEHLRSLADDAHEDDYDNDEQEEHHEDEGDESTMDNEDQDVCKEKKKNNYMAQDLLCDVIDAGKFDQYERIASTLNCSSQSNLRIDTNSMGEGDEAEGDQAEGGMRSSPLSTPHFLPTHPYTRKTIFSSLYQQISHLRRNVKHFTPPTMEDGKSDDIVMGMFQKNNVFVLDQETVNSIQLLQPIVNNNIQHCLNHLQCQHPGPLHHVYDDETGQHFLHGVKCRFLQLGVEIDNEEKRDTRSWTVRTRNSENSTLCTHRGCILAYVQENYPYVLPFDNFYNPNSIAYMLERNIVSIRPYEGLAWSSSDIDMEEGFSGASEVIESVFQIAHVAPTLTKYLWLIELLKLPYEELLFCTEHFINGFGEILNNISFDDMYKILLHQDIASIGKWFYLISFYNPQLLQTIYQRDWKPLRWRSGVYDYESRQSQSETFDSICSLVDLFYNFKCYALLFVNRSFNYHNYGVHMDTHLKLNNSNEYEMSRWHELNTNHWVLSANFLEKNFAQMLESVKKSSRSHERSSYHYGTLHNADNEVIEQDVDDEDEDLADREGYGGPERDEWGNAWNGMDDHMISFCPPPPPSPHDGDYKYLKFVLSSLFLPFSNTLGNAYYPHYIITSKQFQSLDINTSNELQKPLIPSQMLNYVAIENTNGSEWLANMTTALPQYIEDDGEMRVTDIRKGLRFSRTGAYNTFDVENRWLNHSSAVSAHQFELLLLDHALQLRLMDLMSRMVITTSKTTTIDEKTSITTITTTTTLPSGEKIDDAIIDEQSSFTDLIKMHRQKPTWDRWGDAGPTSVLQSSLCTLLETLSDDNKDELFNDIRFAPYVEAVVRKLVSDVIKSPSGDESTEPSNDGVVALD